MYVVPSSETWLSEQGAYTRKETKLKSGPAEKHGTVNSFKKGKHTNSLCDNQTFFPLNNLFRIRKTFSIIKTVPYQEHSAREGWLGDRYRSELEQKCLIHFFAQ